MLKVKVHGAGSIGNHLSHAARTLGWPVDLCDVDRNALERTRRQIYPGRYGQWDEAIGLFESSKAPEGGYDLICVGTPPGQPRGAGARRDRGAAASSADREAACAGLSSRARRR